MSSISLWGSLSKSGKQWLVRAWLFPPSTPWKIRVDMCSMAPFLFQYRNLAPRHVTHWSTLLDLQSDFRAQRETPGASGASSCCILASSCHLHCTHRRRAKCIMSHYQCYQPPQEIEGQYCTNLIYVLLIFALSCAIKSTRNLIFIDFQGFC